MSAFSFLSLLLLWSPSGLASNLDHARQTIKSDNHADKSADAKEKMDLAEFHLFNGNPKAAIKAYREAIAVDPDLFDAHLSLADLFVRTGNKEAAIDQYRQVLRLRPKTKGVNLLLGQLLSAQDDLDGAIDCFQKESELTNKSLPAESSLAFALLAKDKNALAAEKFRELIEKAPDNEDFRLGLAMALSKSNQSEGALEAIDLALKHKPNFPEALNLRGDIFYLGGEREKAIGEYKRAIELDKSFAQSYLSLGNLYLKEGKFSESKDIFVQGAKAVPSDKDLLYGLAFSLEHSGENASAVEVYERALSLEHDPEKATSIKEHLLELRTK